VTGVRAATQVVWAPQSARASVAETGPSCTGLQFGRCPRSAQTCELKPIGTKLIKDWRTFVLNDLVDLVGLMTVVHCVHVLSRQDRTVPRDTVAACANLHCALEGVAFPAEEEPAC
jgi:hypothetical protein